MANETSSAPAKDSQVLPRRSEVEILFHQRHKAQAVNGAVIVNHCHIHAAIHDQFAQRGAEVLIEVEHDAGMLLLHFHH